MAKKDKAPKLPKKVGGVKVPKQLRKTARSALEIAQNPLAREIVSAALTAGAVALAKGKGHSGKAAPHAAAAPTADKIDLGSVIAAFVSGFDKGAEMMSDKIAPKAKPKNQSKPKT